MYQKITQNLSFLKDWYSGVLPVAQIETVGTKMHFMYLQI